MRLTNEGIYKYAQSKYDKANTPGVPRPEFKLFYEEARNEWLALTDKDFELTEKRRSDHRGFVITTSFSGDTFTLPDDVLFIKAMITDFANGCNPGANYKVPVPPRTWDEITASLTNAHQCPTDQAPAYVEANNAVEIYSETVPTNTKIVYMKRPPAFDLVGDPNGFTLENREQQEIIIDIAVAKIKLKFGDYNAYQAIKNVEIPTSE